MVLLAAKTQPLLSAGDPLEDEADDTGEIPDPEVTIVPGRDMQPREDAENEEEEDYCRDLAVAA